MAYRFCSAALLGLALSSGLYSLARTENAYGQSSAKTNARHAVSDYVIRTREIGQKAFSLKPMPDQGALKVFRVVVTAEIAWIPDIERVFDVHVDPVTGLVSGEHSVRM